MPRIPRNPAATGTPDDDDPDDLLPGRPMPRWQRSRFQASDARRPGVNSQNLNLSGPDNPDELIPGYPMPRWQRGKYDRGKMRSGKQKPEPPASRLQTALRAVRARLRRTRKPGRARMQTQ